jgi:hypothetical protein
MNALIDTNGYRNLAEDEYDEEIMYAGWNPDVALLVYQQERARGPNADRRVERLCDANGIHFLHGQQYPFAK